jgi:hypothetical protein
VEQEQGKTEAEKVRAEQFKERKNTKELIAQCITSISRIAHQLKEDHRIVDPSKADQKLSVCGLRLEHMVATLYKKKPTFNIETVNTDFSLNLPPYFLGLKNNLYVGEDEIQNQEGENSFERVYQLQTKTAGKKDEFQKQLEDQYREQKAQKKKWKRQQYLRNQMNKNNEDNKDLENELKKAEEELEKKPKETIHNINAGKMLKKLKSNIEKRTDMQFGEASKMKRSYKNARESANQMIVDQREIREWNNYL